MSKQTSDTEPVLIIWADHEVVVHSHDADLLLTIAWEAKRLVPFFPCDVRTKEDLYGPLESICIAAFIQKKWAEEFATKAAEVAIGAGHRVTLDPRGYEGEEGQQLIEGILASRKN